MARKGKQSLADTVDESEIIESGEELGSINYLIDEDYAIRGNTGDFALMVRKIANRVGTEKDGENEGKVIQYEKWDVVKPFSYGGTPFKVLENYADHINLKKFKKLDKCNDFGEVKKIYLDTQATIRKALREWSMAKDNTECGMLLEEIADLRKQLNEAKDLIKEVNDFKAWMKSKRAELFKNVEPTKHRVKLEK